MLLGSATRRLAALRRQLLSPSVGGAVGGAPRLCLSVSLSSGGSSPAQLQQQRDASVPGTTTVSVGDVSVTVRWPARPDLVPRGWESPEHHTQERLAILRWMLQKYALRQDMFLLGHPGPERRRLAFTFAEILQLETEYVALTRDTVEADLVQRREIVGGNVVFVDSACVRAALNGRLLILDGVEKAERNVLPILNSLLASREMTLTDGRHLVDPDRYEALLSRDEAEKTVPVSRDFCVVALGLPVPRFPGHPLDPPLRSRFSACNVPPLSLFARLETLGGQSGVQAVCSVREALSVVGGSLPVFPEAGLTHLGNLLRRNGRDTVDARQLHRAYPFRLVCDQAGQTTVKEALARFNVLPPPPTTTAAAGRLSPSSDGAAAPARVSHFISTDFHEQLLSEMAEDHAVGRNLCLVGPRGSGKTTVVQEFARRHGYSLIRTVHLHSDTTSRDLLQRRVTDEFGNTDWVLGPVVLAALEGSLVVLEDLDHLPAGTLSSLDFLLNDGCLVLADGTRLLSAAHFDALGDARPAGAKRVHPDFRVVALARAPDRRTHPWLTEEFLPFFSFVEFPSPPAEVQREVIARLHPGAPADLLLRVAAALADGTERALTLSLRNLLRLARTLEKFPDADLVALVERMLMTPFLPVHLAQAFDNIVRPLAASAVITTPTSATTNSSSTAGGNVSTAELPPVEIHRPPGSATVSIGGTVLPVAPAGAHPELVPHVAKFVPVQSHLRLLSEVARDLAAGERFHLLIGNQGTGKNVLTDYLCQLLNRERVMMVLSRDSTVMSLTVTPTLVDGRLRYLDSPVVRAATEGLVLLLDEADKAPTEVTSMLSGLFGDGQLALGDGRVLGGPDMPISPNFVCFVLANPAKFPFAGNKVFGDTFACHIVGTVDRASELHMLSAYGPRVPVSVLARLLDAFGSLRALNLSGQISYPFSTRELVQIARHLDTYPDDGLLSALDNVLHFDSYDPTTVQTLESAFAQHGLPVKIGAAARASPAVRLAGATKLPRPTRAGRLVFEADGEARVTVASEVHRPRALSVDSGPSRSVGAWEQRRFGQFSEEVLRFRLPFSEPCEAESVTALPDAVFVLVRDPAALVVCSAAQQYRRCVVVQLDEVMMIPDGALGRGVLSPLAGGRVFLHLVAIGVGVVLKVDAETGRTELRAFEVGERRQAALKFLSPGYRIGSSWSRDAAAAAGPLVTVEGGAGAPSQVAWFRPNQKHFSVVDASDHDAPVVYRVDLHGRELLGLSAPDDAVAGAERCWRARTAEGDLLCVRLDGGSPGGVLRAAAGEAAAGPVVPWGFVSGVGWAGAASKSTSSPAPAAPAAAPKIGSLVELSRQRDGSCAVDVTDVPSAAPQDRSEWPEDFPVVAPVVGTGRVLVVADTPSSLVVVDAASRTLRRLVAEPAPARPAPAARLGSRHQLSRRTGLMVGLAAVPATAGSERRGDLVSVDLDTLVRVWQLDSGSLASESRAWQKLFGSGRAGSSSQRMALQVNGKARFAPKGPKFGKIDKDRKPHHGGNTWAGGTGGSDTAGLGGAGGPFRLDGGHGEVRQVSDEEKAKISKDVQEQARAMAQAELARRLAEIGASKEDDLAMTKLEERVAVEVNQLREVLQAAEARKNDREWARFQSHGELDDGRLVDGVTGEKQIFKRRVAKPPPVGSPARRPKLLHFLFDVSGSMYRFNSADGRLDRSIECALLLMDTLSTPSLATRYRYALVGHSGDGPRSPLVDYQRPPQNRLERLRVLQRMRALSQFCASGDSTLEAVKQGVTDVLAAEADADEHIVFLISDANLRRYGIRPLELRDAMVADRRVRVFAIFIASQNDEAERIARDLPPEHAFVCRDVGELPHIFRRLLASTATTAPVAE